MAEKPSVMSQSDLRAPSPYEVALNELRELESGPQCHSIAARLLVNSCHFIEDKNETAVLADSGRVVRDFVDSYAASLAICDLERGSFQIPDECSNFRETVLSRLPLDHQGHLHNTWVSYRHKAVRFCEAAQAENRKAQKILLFERVTKIMWKFTNEVEEKFEHTMVDLNSRAKATGKAIDDLSPQLDRLRNGLEYLQGIMLSSLNNAFKDTADSAEKGARTAIELQRILEMILNNSRDGQTELASAYERSLQAASPQVDSAMGRIVDAISVIADSSLNLQRQAEASHGRMLELESRQKNIELASNNVSVFGF
ncbi:hypothetical protein GGS23DRAFT_598478 [Durotheca rogersii]|uniref:uncharacterized protein n=1 Tax=Durotheca rogersii TaxID=419775 RepID=UPI0022211EAF|nr:uncharacterized protein GGS23DRAFT_598478 [Durotheca rogersii]KAI5861311.1 hypothetical protein GGS23DRAFT_598478 [Durotheca rogersii]